jgi:gliding motility-associated-like protein
MKTNCSVIQKILLVFFFGCLLFNIPAKAQTAQYATAGTGSMKNYICWFDWAGVSVANNATKNFTTADGLNVTVTFSNVSGPAIMPSIMNVWSGAVLWKLYDFADPAIKPALFSDATISPAGFTMNIMVTRAGVPTPFTLVVADAEASAPSEVTTLETNGSPWKTIEFYRNSGQTSNPLSGCGTQKVDLSLTYGDAPETGQNPILATDATGALTVKTLMNRSEQGGMAVAFGIFAPIDGGDLPSPYPKAYHKLSFTVNNSCNFNPPLPSISQGASLHLGSVAGDADGVQTLDDNSTGTDEEAISSFPLYNGSSNYTLSLPLLNNTGSIAFLTGWFDYNRDGNFTTGESISVTVPNGATSATLTWAGLPSTLQGPLSDYGFRFRLGTKQSEIQKVSGYTIDGEVEDYLVPYTVITPNSTNVNVSFTAPDTVCVNTPVNITNTSTSASSYYWNFCVASIDAVPTVTNLGNPGGLTMPVFIDYGLYNGNYYGFLVNYNPGRLIRLDFGNSLLNNPTSVDLGNFSGVIPTGAEGIQIVQNEGSWYAIIVGGSPAAGSSPRILKMDFGPNLTNVSPIATNWGNLGNMLQPIDLHVFKEGTNWYGFTVNSENNTITRFNFTNSFNNMPTAVNLGNIGNLKYPTGIYAINDNGFWRVFVVNGGDNTRTSNACSLTRLDFGSSLLNAPTGVNLGNPGSKLQHPRDLTIMKLCDQVIGFAVNGNPNYNDLVKVNFNNNLSASPVVSTLGNTGNLNFPHSISKLFRVNNDVYGFITNVGNNTISRLKFDGCTNSSLPNSTLQNPTPVVYDSPGTYSINLTVDDGLPTQATYCKQVVVVASPTPSLKTFSICSGNTIKIGSAVRPAKYVWSTGAITDSIIVNTPGVYWVESDGYGCSVRDSFIISPTTLPPIDFGFQQDICSPQSVQFTSNLSGIQSYQWHFGDGQTNGNSQTPTITYKDYGLYTVKLIVQYNGGCMDSVIKAVTVEEQFDKNLILNNDTTICLGDSILLKTANTVFDYCWQTSSGMNPSLNTYINPGTTTTYVLKTQVIGDNLVNNGNFSNGNTGFASQYIYSNSGLPAAVYTVGSNVLAWHPGMTPCQDHTTGSGNMMMVNGADQPNVKVWSQAISIKPNTNYVFYSWLQTITTINPARLQFSINGNALGNIFNANSQSCIWERFYSTWNSGNNTTATISIMNMSQEFSGNDFALDDIFFGEVSAKTDSFTVNVTGLCDSVKITGPNKVCDKNDILTYAIYKSPNCKQQYSLVVDNAFADIVSQTDTSIKLSFKHDGTVPVKIAFANDCRIVVDSINVEVKLSPATINLGPDISACRDTLIQLNAGTGFESYLWQDGSVDSIYTVNAPGAYFVLAQNFCGVQFKDTFSLIKSLPGPFKVAPLNVSVCKGDSIQFNASGGTVYSWQPTSGFNNPGIASPKAIINESQDFTVQISDIQCARDTVVLIPVIAKDKADIMITKKNDVNCRLDSTVLIASGGISYNWAPNLYISRSHGNQITVKPPQTTTYYLQGKDAGGCIGQDSVTVYFVKEGEQKLFMPNAFTPNNDGLNDLFKPIFTGPATKFDFKIFNRWGQLVFQTSTVGKGWDGTFKFRAQPKDVYVYYITAEGGCNGKFEQKGTFALIK